MASDDWVIWLREEAGEVFLGLPASNAGESRFCVLGKFQEHLDGVGIWVEVDFVQQVRVADNTTIKTWEVQPRSCMIPWSYIAYVQRGKNSGQFGFIPKNSN
jgi:hypothetical protein